MNARITESRGRPPTPADGIVIPRHRRSPLPAVLIIVAGGLGAATLVLLGGAGLFAKDVDPPQITIVNPQEGVRYNGLLFINGKIADASNLESFCLYLDGVDRTPTLNVAGKRAFKFNFKLNTSLMADGRHEIAVVAADYKRNRAVAKVAFYVENHPAILQLNFQPNNVAQGRALIVKLTANKKLYNLVGKIWEQEFPFYAVRDGFMSIVGIRASCPPGEYPVVVTGYDAYDQPLELKGIITVADGGYIKEEIKVVAPDKKALFDPELEEKKMLEYRKEQAILTRARDEQLWGGVFIVPAPGKITSPFGTYRKFSTGGEERHLGVDIANREGTPVRAANRGVVMLAEELIVRGKCVIIDHGRGVFTIYNHLSGLAVKPGDKVEKGQVIGWMGSTGLATGPHLHWELRVFKWVVDPMEWTTSVFTYRTPEEEERVAAEIEEGYKVALAAPMPAPVEPAAPAVPATADAARVTITAEEEY